MARRRLTEFCDLRDQHHQNIILHHHYMVPLGKRLKISHFQKLDLSHLQT